MNSVIRKACTRCIMDSSDQNIHFDDQGVCDRCRQFDKDILPKWNYGKGKKEELDEIITRIKKHGTNRQYDCILGLSGGFDSSYLLHLAVKEFGLRPLVFHVDAGWNIPFAVDNIKKMTTKLGVDLKIEKLNWEEMKALQLAFFRSGVPHLDIPQDNAFVAILDDYARKYNVKYVLNGGNISTEVVVNPSGWGYWGTDIVQNKDIVRRFCSKKIREYKFTNVVKRKIVMPYVYGVKVVKPLNYVEYVKKDAEALLVKEYGYIPYGQKHFEDVLTMFLEGYWLPKRFGFDVRRPQLSSLILTGQMKRAEALDIMKEPPLSEAEGKELFSLIAQKLEISEMELQKYFEMPLRSYRDYRHNEWLFSLGSKVMYLMKLDKLIRK